MSPKLLSSYLSASYSHLSFLVKLTYDFMESKELGLRSILDEEPLDGLYHQL
jgi:hypothetical protein